ncbi:hypothetical protein D3C71_1638110 [compost metagenome]
MGYPDDFLQRNFLPLFCLQRMVAVQTPVFGGKTVFTRGIQLTARGDHDVSRAILSFIYALHEMLIKYLNRGFIQMLSTAVGLRRVDSRREADARSAVQGSDGKLQRHQWQLIQ